MFNPPENLPVVDSIAIHLPEDFLAIHDMANKALTNENLNHLAQWALEHFRPDLLGMPMDWNMEEKINQVFSELHQLLPSEYKNKFVWSIQKIRPDPWHSIKRDLIWNIIVCDHLAVTFNTR